MLNLREYIKGLHLNQHQIEINMSAQFQILKNKIKKIKNKIYITTVKYTTIDGLLCITYTNSEFTKYIMLSKFECE